MGCFSSKKAKDGKMTNEDINKMLEKYTRVDFHKWDDTGTSKVYMNTEQMNMFKYNR